MFVNCQNHDWMLFDILYNGKPYKEYNTLFNENPDKKIEHSLFSQRDQYFKGEFGIDPRSELSQKLIDPLDKEFIRMSGENPEPRDSMNAITKREREISIVYVYVFINKKKIEGKQFTDEKIPRAALVTKTNYAFRDSCNWDSYFLAFGNWQDAKENNEGVYSYKFKLRENSHRIENFVVVLTGAKQRINEPMTKTDWSIFKKEILD